jgi:hypothetical protein
MFIKFSLFVNADVSTRNGSQNAICDEEALIAAESTSIMICCIPSNVVSATPVNFVTVVCNECALLFASIENDDSPATIIATRNAIDSICVERKDEQERRSRLPYLVIGVSTDDPTEMISSVSNAEW